MESIFLIFIIGGRNDLLEGERASPRFFCGGPKEKNSEK